MEKSEIIRLVTMHGYSHPFTWGLGMCPIQVREIIVSPYFSRAFSLLPPLMCPSSNWIHQPTTLWTFTEDDHPVRSLEDNEEVPALPTSWLILLVALLLLLFCEEKGSTFHEHDIPSKCHLLSLSAFLLYYSCVWGGGG